MIQWYNWYKFWNEGPILYRPNWARLAQLFLCWENSQGLLLPVHHDGSLFFRHDQTEFESPIWIWCAQSLECLYFLKQSKKCAGVQWALAVGSSISALPANGLNVWCPPTPTWDFHSSWIIGPAALSFPRYLSVHIYCKKWDEKTRMINMAKSCWHILRHVGQLLK